VLPKASPGGTRERSGAGRGKSLLQFKTFLFTKSSNLLHFIRKSKKGETEK
jgi:hypothetical protein